MASDSTSDLPPVCDYEGSDYRTRFWENQGRSYEDQAERIALHRLMPAAGDTLIEIGAGFGRLADEYLGYRRVVLFDYSRSLLREAQEYLRPHDPAGDRFIYVAGNWYQMPFVHGLFATIVQVRTLHHAADAPALFRQLAQIARPGGSYVLEFANKRNLKAILRYAVRRQSWSPFAHEPVEFAALNFDFHPAWIRQELTSAGFAPGRTLAVSHFRLDLLKCFIPHHLLAAVDGMLQPTGRWWSYTPSIFIRSAHPGAGPSATADSFFACPQCGSPLGGPTTPENDQVLPCVRCNLAWRLSNGIYDFKEPVEVAAAETSVRTL
jgi:SAM-dependent methyltransferase